ncbi:CTP synthase [Pseudomonas alliivorans]|uniref:CTP synthase n=1 Tax=Pseudomonas fragariae (ex Marin et al. 2024) TaxID=3080056 RepID=UPI002EC2E884|nr:CTP synthase [Pseudomonas alliivorans]MEE5126073.1 CTP synthase [Pseudomonas alliivorans]
MELVYSNQRGDFDPNKRYRNPDLFRNVERGVTKVTVVGDYPEIVDAYKAVEIDVEIETRKTPVKGKSKVAEKAAGKSPTKPQSNGTQKDGTKEEPVYIPKLEADNQWIIITRDGVRFSDFAGDEAQAKAEADRLNETKD